MTTVITAWDVTGEPIRPPNPGERCELCHRRVYKPRQKSSPESRKIRAGFLPNERATAVEEGLDALQEFVGADSSSYARGELIVSLVALGASEREYLRIYYQGDADAL